MLDSVTCAFEDVDRCGETISSGVYGQDIDFEKRSTSTSVQARESRCIFDIHFRLEQFLDAGNAKIESSDLHIAGWHLLVQQSQALLAPI